MPELKDILVHVTVDGLDENGERSYRPLEEFGVQKMRKSKQISAYIEAETGKSFRILIQPKIPFPSKYAPTTHEYNTRQKVKARENSLKTARPGFLKTDEDWHNDGNHFSPRILDRHGRSRSDIDSEPRRRSSNSDSFVNIKEEPTDEHMTFSSPAPSMEKMVKRTPPPPFHLLASLYLDGRKRPDRRVFVHLDPEDDIFNYPSGEVEIKTRWVQDKDGNIKEQSWVFQDIGIETLFDKMLIAEDKNAMPRAQRNQAALVNAFDNIYLNGDSDFVKEEKSKVGQILVTIDRVTLGKRWQDTNYQAKLKEQDMEDVDMMDAGKEITHTTGFAHKKTIMVKSEGVPVVYYYKFKTDEDHFATFQFFYRSKSILQKFGFAGLPKAIPYVLPSKSSNMAFKTPLSIISSTSKARATGTRDRIAAVDNGKKKVKGSGLFSEKGFGHNMCRQARQFPKKEESESLRNDQSNMKSLSSSSLLPGGHCSNLALPASFLDLRDRARYNLRNFSNTNKLSLMTSSLSFPFGQNEMDRLLCRASSDRLGSTPIVSVTPRSGAEDGLLKSTGEAETRSASDTYNFSNLGSTLRENTNYMSDADDEREAYDMEAHFNSDRDQENHQACQNKDDQGLSIGVKELILGKRGRESEDRDLEEAGTRAKKVALDETRLCPIQMTFVERA
ncbi:hypothetical protein MMC17_007033 [Xylographa soralifera]|nr:hypothetical protein [Xylographa soralifera]